MYGPSKSDWVALIAVFVMIGIVVGIAIAVSVPWVLSHLRVSWT